MSVQAIYLVSALCALLALAWAARTGRLGHRRLVDAWALRRLTGRAVRTRAVHDAAAAECADTTSAA